MALIDGDDFIDGSILSYQEGNRLKNNFRETNANIPTNPSSGMLFSRSDGDNLYHFGADWEEVLQGGGVSQWPAVADATGAGDVVARLNELLARMRTIGLIAT